MVKHLKVAVLAAAVTSGIWMACTGIGLPKWYSRDYTCLVLTDDVVLKSNWTNEAVGTLKRGVVLFVPDGEDYQVTDPGDSSLHKVYIGITAEISRKGLKEPPEIPQANTMEINDYLKAYPRNTK